MRRDGSTPHGVHSSGCPTISSISQRSTSGSVSRLRWKKRGLISHALTDPASFAEAGRGSSAAASASLVSGEQQLVCCFRDGPCRAELQPATAGVPAAGGRWGEVGRGAFGDVAGGAADELAGAV